MSKNNDIQNLDVINFIKSIYGNNKFIPLHEPRFFGNEKKYLEECIDSTYVSSVGKFVDQFEDRIAKYTGAKYAVATNNGTSAIHISLILANVDQNCEVITQAINFVASCNAISYCNASPIFIDVDRDTMGLSPSALKFFLDNNTTVKNKQCINNRTSKVIKACIPMHSYGHPCRIEEIKKICDEYNIFLIEDAAESVGSLYKGRHTGTFGQLAAMSFNGNKIVTAGGGGCVITDDEILAKKAKHLTTTAKVPHRWDFYHDQIGYNYRMPNLNASLGIAQIEKLEYFIKKKRELAKKYHILFENTDIEFFNEPENTRSNYWLNTLIFKNEIKRNDALEYTNKNKIMTRPPWTLMTKLNMFSNCERSDIKNSEELEKKVLNIPSSVPIEP